MIRVAIAMLTGDLAKYAGVLFGIAVTTFLTTLVGSMFAGMLSRTYALIDDNPSADVWVMDPACQTVTQPINIPETAIDRVRSVAGVAEAERLAVGSVSTRLPHGRFISVDVIGADDATLRGVPESVPRAVAELLRSPDAVLADPAVTRAQLVVPMDDADSWAGGGPRLEVLTRTMPDADEVMANNHSVRVRGVVAGAPRFNPQPVFYMTYSNASRILPPTRHRLTFVLVRADRGQDPVLLARDIERSTGLRARTAGEFRRDTVLWFFANAEFISHVGIMVTFAAVVGLAITGLMLYMFTRENARYYATLRAIGATPVRLMSMVVSQSLFAGAVGFGLGIGVCAIIGTLLAQGGFPFRILPITPIAVGTLSLTVTTIAAMLSAWAVLRIEPAMVFKS